MEFLRSSVGLSVLENCFYVVGGFNGFRNLNLIECFDIRVGKWMNGLFL